jgi:lipopolysaccharide transport protein LptA
VRRFLAPALLACSFAFASGADPILEEAERPPAAPKSPKAASPLSLLGSDAVFTLSAGGDRSAPVTIRSDLMEASESEGRRTLRFERNVEVRQGELLLRTHQLEAVYPVGSKQPSRLRARGGVLLREGGREARCARADYQRAAERITCAGDAVLKDGDDEIRGESIVFDLAARRATVRGGTRVAVAPREPRTPGSGLLEEVEGLGGGAGVTIEADELQAWETPEGRRLAFGGRVGVVRDDVSLEAGRIEAFYPPGATEPSHVVASGEVRVLQADREARCDLAEYYRRERRLECRGDARLRQDEDRLSGDLISFDLAAERLVVTGGSRLTLAPREPGESSGETRP